MENIISIPQKEVKPALMNNIGSIFRVLTSIQKIDRVHVWWHNLLIFKAPNSSFLTILEYKMSTPFQICVREDKPFYLLLIHHENTDEGICLAIAWNKLDFISSEINQKIREKMQDDVIESKIEDSLKKTDYILIRCSNEAIEKAKVVIEETFF